MIDEREIVRRAAEALTPPEPSFDRLLHRRNRVQRNRRIRAGVLGIAVAIAVGWVGINAIRSAPPKPADDRPDDLGIFAPVAGRIVYGNEAGIWGVDPAAPADPAATVQLTSEAGIPLGWSSDGTELLIGRIERASTDGAGLFVLHADGSETLVTADPMFIGSTIAGATISPDGSRVVFVGGTGELLAVDADGGPAEVLAESREGNLKDPTFSPDGTRIAYTDGGGDHSHHVWVMGADGSDAHEIVFNEWTDAAGHVYGLDWSPAGDRIALGLEGTTYTFAPDGSDFKRVITPGDFPYWSPEGSQIAYTIDCFEAPDGCGLAIADADGSNVQTLGFAASGPWHPGAQVEESSPTPMSTELRRDGENIVFQRSGAESGWDLAAQDPETGEIRKIVETDGIVDCPGLERCTSFVQRAEWSADGRWVAFEVSYGSLDRLPWGPCGPTAGVWVQGPVGAPRQLTRPCEATPGVDGIEELWAWSPVGARLAYARVDGQDDKLFVIDPSDGSRTLHLSGGGDRTALEWSPDGTRIAVASEGEGVLEVGVDPGGLWELGGSFEDVIDIDYSPDGTQIMVHDQGRYRIQVMNANGSDLHLLLEGEDACCESEWSPNGNRIIYQLSIENGTSSPFDSEVWTVAPNDSDRIKVFDSDGCDMGATDDALPVWAPNGTQVAYNACGVWVVSNADGTGEAQPIDELVHRSWAGGGLSGWDLL